MFSFRSKFAFSTLAMIALGQNPSSAAWNNVYQVSCNSANKVNVSTSNYQPVSTPCNLPGCTQQICQQQNCSTRYVQKFYYEPVTSYESTSYYEPVTTYKTSYYYEPVTSYKTSYYYDPSSCGYQQMATPVTSYQLKAQNCPVNSYMLRTALKPVTSYKQSYYYEPQTTCCNTMVGTPVIPQVAAPCTTPAPVPNPNIAPGVNEQRATPSPAPAAAAPGISENRDLAPNPTNSSRSSVIPGKTVSPVMPAPQIPSSVKLDRIVSLKSSFNLEGSVVGANQVPAKNARLFLVHETVRGLKVNLTTDANGWFSANVEPGNWLVYLADVDGRPVFQKQIEVKSSEIQTMKLVSR